MVEARDQRGELVVILARFALALGRVGLRARTREVIDLAGELVEALMHAREVFAVEVFILVGAGLCAVRGGLLQDDRVQPIAQRHTGPTRCLARAFARFRSDAFDTPRHAKLHSHTQLGGGVRARISPRGTGAR
ncbi:hypothetical protein DW352_14785 [Pseudolabrys taiwanensis]|uniref:Uncharacterized protein n=1 Tax=Pseudolabrys taiwanensis TaxID=331696 RepID=A0A345ZXM9_9HYPH|nr:hypothetical protein DW352_14785 [Pseudolabrys taiwanensis]